MLFLLLLCAFVDCIQMLFPLEAQTCVCLVRPVLHLLLAGYVMAECWWWSCVCVHTGVLHPLCFLLLCWFPVVPLEAERLDFWGGKKKNPFWLSYAVYYLRIDDNIWHEASKARLCNIGNMRIARITISVNFKQVYYAWFVSTKGRWGRW